jgi:hypothetical protein
MKAIASLLTLTMPVLLTFAGFHAPLADADTFGSGANRFNVEFVSIGNPGNPADTVGYPDAWGSVPHVYRMGKYEISKDMIDKANAEGGLGITQTNWSSNKPATSVSWFEAARFVNWLNATSGSTPAYKFEFQPGEVGYDSNAAILLWDSTDAGYDPNNPFRNKLGRYVLPTENEWYKAAFYDPTLGVYYEYPTGSDTPPTPVASGTAPGTAVYDHYDVGSPADITLAGGLSPYGTMAQAGNVGEWMESWDEYGRAIIRDAQWFIVFEDAFLLSSSGGGQGDSPSLSDSGIGFRVASIPEPSAALIVALAATGLLVWRRRLANP